MIACCEKEGTLNTNVLSHLNSATKSYIKRCILLGLINVGFRYV